MASHGSRFPGRDWTGGTGLGDQGLKDMFLIATIVTTSKALVTTSNALVPSSLLFHISWIEWTNFLWGDLFG